MRNEPTYQNADYNRAHWLLVAEHLQRQADLAGHFGLGDFEQIYRSGIGKAKVEAERYRLALIGGK